MPTNSQRSRAPFRSETDFVLRLGIALAAMGSTGAIAAGGLWVRTPAGRGLREAPPQPIAFDHRHHVQDAKIDCLYCHYDAPRSAHAGVPDTALCMGCHAHVWSDAPALAPLHESWTTQTPLRWRRVYDLPDTVDFAHAPHLHAGVGCETCHGRVDQMAAVRLAVPLEMGCCLDCHRNRRRTFGRNRD